MRGGQQDSDVERNIDLTSAAPNKNEDESTPLLPEKSSIGTSAYLRGCCGLCEWFAILKHHFGVKLLVLLCCVQHVLKGFVFNLKTSATPYLFRTYHVPAPQVQIFRGIQILPWALKPIIGLISDILPICGYRKAPYIFVTSALGVGAFLYIGCLPHDWVSITMLVFCLFLMNAQISTADLLSEAKYAEKIQLAPEHGPALMTYVWFGLQFGGFVAVLVLGSLLQYVGPKIFFLICAFPASLILIPVFMGFFEEEYITSAELAKIRSRYYEQKEACMLAVLMFVSSIAIISVGILTYNPLVSCICAVCVGIVLLVSFSLVLSPVIAKFNAFALVQSALGLSTAGASFYFYTDTEEMYPEGPHFSEFFYVTVMGICGSVFSLVGILLYQRYMSTWKYRNLFVVTNVVLTCFSMLDVLMFARVNVRWGIPDTALVLGLSVFDTIIGTWQWMPQVVILANLCPKGMEATMYALLAGCHNMGNTIAASTGALLLQELGVQPRGAKGESAMFEKLWVAALFSTMLPLVSVLLLYRLVPDARQDERILDATMDATSGSLWRRWFN